MEKEELFYRMALSQIEGIGPVRYKKILEGCHRAKDIFTKGTSFLKSIEGLGLAHRKSILQFRNFDSIEKEISYAEAKGIQILEESDPCYPQKLRQCADSPSILFYQGQADLNHTRSISVIGTRNNTEYGRKICEELIAELQQYNLQIISGLALGIDSIAHKSSLRHGIPTIGVLAHGLHTIYPRENRRMAVEMQEKGGLLAEYFSHGKIDRGNFPTRNRIVAGLTDALLIIETDAKGGSMITADIAYSYNKDIFCVPGRLNDTKSRGCNFLIQKLKAQMITSAQDIADSLGWIKNKKQKPIQQTLFLELTETEKKITGQLTQNESLHLDELLILCQLSYAQLAASLLNLEMQQVVQALPGKMYKLMV